MGKQLTFETDDGKNANIWIYDLSGTTSMRQLTFAASNRFPMWSGDGERIVFQSDREGEPALFWQRADGGGVAERLVNAEQGTDPRPDSWPAHGQQFSFSAVKHPALPCGPIPLGKRRPHRSCRTRDGIRYSLISYDHEDSHCH